MEQQPPLGNNQNGTGPVVCRRRRSAPSTTLTSPEPASSSSPPPSPNKQNVQKTLDSLGLRIKTVESAASTGSQADYFKPEQTILIFDWDDTICPSTWIQANRRVLSFFRPVPNDPGYQQPLKELEAHAEAVLLQAMQIGSVVIITNAADPWVEISCRNFLPKLLPIISKLPIIYARSVFYSSLDCAAPGAAGRAAPGRASSAGPAARAPGSAAGRGAAASAAPGLTRALLAMQLDEVTPQHWKEVAFEQEIAGFYSRYSHQSWKNVVSIGDSVFERDATQQVVMQRPSTKKACRAKTVKMFDDPTIEELIAQVRLLGDLLGALVQYDGDLNIEIDMGDLQEAGLLDPA